MTHIAVLPHDPLGFASFQLQLEQALRRWLAPAEPGIDPLWDSSRATLTEFALRPAKRVRPTLLAAGFAAAQGHVAPDALVDFGAGLELLHAFMLVHDDIADRATLRRGGLPLHLALGGGHTGEAQAVVAGDYLFARAFEAMLEAPGARTADAARSMLSVCRATAAGQHLDLALANAPLADVRLRQVLKVARLKTARYGFVAPLVCGAMLAKGEPQLLARLSAIGEAAGLAYQLRDDVIGLFGDDSVAGKAGGGDFLEARRTFPVLAAWLRADAAGRAHLEALWSEPAPARLAEARAAVTAHGGLAATETLIERCTRLARARLAKLGSPALGFLDSLLASLALRHT